MVQKRSAGKDKNKFVYYGIILLVLIIIWVFYLSLYKPIGNTLDTGVHSNDLVFYYGYTCEHCKTVEQYMTSNEIEEKLSDRGISVIKKEIFKNQDNNMEFNLIAEGCKIKPDERGVPFVYFNGKCYVGTTDVMSILDDASK